MVVRGPVFAVTSCIMRKERQKHGVRKPRCPAFQTYADVWIVSSLCFWLDLRVGTELRSIAGYEWNIGRAILNKHIHQPFLSSR